ncbi:MAG: imelysin family protein [Rhodovibrionaceae bacterium]
MSEEAYAEVNAALAESHVLPRYRNFAEAAAKFAEVTEDFCKASGQSDDGALQAGFDEVMDAWMGVQHLRFGPAELFLRAYRIAFWPQAQGRFVELVGDLLSQNDPARLTEESFGTAGVAVQGLPAAEVLIYSEAALDGQRQGEVGRCNLLRAIGRNLSVIASDIRRDWEEGAEPFLATLKQPGPDNPYFATHQDATLVFFKSLHDQLQLIADAKLKPVVGVSAETAEPKLVETPLAKRALRNILLNLEALQALYHGEDGSGLSQLVAASGSDADLDPLMRKAFDQTLANARSIDQPLAEAVADPANRPKVEKLLTQVLALKQIVKTRVAQALEVSVGFNALDGD